MQSDREPEALIHSMHLSGYTVLETVEQTAADRLATARLQPSEAAETGALLDLLFASSGIENEIVAEAECVEILSDLLIPVARIDVDAAVCGHIAADIAQGLAAGDPDIRVTQHGDWLSINPQFMEAGDVALVVAALHQVLGS